MFSLLKSSNFFFAKYNLLLGNILTSLTALSAILLINLSLYILSAKLFSISHLHFLILLNSKLLVFIQYQAHILLLKSMFFAQIIFTSNEFEIAAISVIKSFFTSKTHFCVLICASVVST